MIDINEYFSSFPLENASEIIGDIELNKILLNRIPNGWIKQAYVQGFYCGPIALKTFVNIFERTEIAESIHDFFKDLLIKIYWIRC